MTSNDCSSSTPLRLEVRPALIKKGQRINNQIKPVTEESYSTYDSDSNSESDFNESVIIAELVSLELAGRWATIAPHIELRAHQKTRAPSLKKVLSS